MPLEDPHWWALTKQSYEQRERIREARRLPEPTRGTPVPSPTDDPLRALREAVERPSWQADAACRGKDTNIFFSSRAEDVAHARALCASCPVIEACREAGRSEQGVWGGVAQRTTIRAGTRVWSGKREADSGVVLEGIEHGKNSMYTRGCRCDACREAHTAYCRSLRERKRAA